VALKGKSYSYVSVGEIMSGGKQGFFDACAGIGCFHLGMQEHFRCVGAAEWDKGLQNRYPLAFHLESSRMFSSVHGLVETPQWIATREEMRGAVMLAGFPCTPFSKSGKQSGKKHKEGTVFWSLLEMMDDLECPAFIFENVTNMLGKNHELVWTEMRKELLKRGYSIDWEKIRATEVGVPQNRNRVFIVGKKEKIPTERVFFRRQFQEIKTADYEIIGLLDLLGKSVYRGTPLSDSHSEALIHWERYLGWLEERGKMGLIRSIAKPLWAMEAWHGDMNDDGFYDIEKLQIIIDDNNGVGVSESQLRSCMPNAPGGMDVEEIIGLLPPYFRKVALGTGKNYPERAKFAMNSRIHMGKVRELVGTDLDDWIGDLRKLDPSFQKFEWHIGRELPKKSRAKDPARRIRTRFGEHLVQFRSSGVRVSRARRWPTMVAIGQVPYTGNKLLQPNWRTLALLQSIPSEFIKSNEYLFGGQKEAVKRLGNAVNVEIVRQISMRLRKLL